MAQMNALRARVAEILGDDCEATFESQVQTYYHFLTETLQLPCDVAGAEEFQWEEIYVVGSGNPDEYQRLCREQPSFADEYELAAIELGVSSDWMMCPQEDIAARVRRKTDGKLFSLGLAELVTIDDQSNNYRVLRDYSMWFKTSR